MELRIRERVEMVRQWKVNSEVFSLEGTGKMVVLLTEVMRVDLGVRNNHRSSS